MDNFLSKIVSNWLHIYDHSYADDNILRNFVARFVGHEEHSGWIAEFHAQEKKFTKTKKRDEMVMINPREFLTPEAFELILEKSDRDAATDFEISTTTKTLGELLDLGRAEMLFLEFAARIERTDYSIRELFELMRFSESNKYTDRLYSYLFDVSEKDIVKARTGFLFNCGMLSFGEQKTFPIAAEPFDSIIAQDDLTVDLLQERLFPNCLETNLTVDDYSHLSEEVEMTGTIIEKALKNHMPGMNVMFWGIPGTGKTQLSLAMARKYGFNIRSIGDISPRDDREKSRESRLASLKIAIKLYGSDTNTVLLFDEMEDIFKADLKASFSKAFINRIIETTPIPIIWTTNNLISIGEPVLRRMVYNIEFDTPSVDARVNLWKKYCGEHNIKMSDSSIESMAMEHEVTPALISNATLVSGMLGLTEKKIETVVRSMSTLVNYGAKMQQQPKIAEDELYDMAFINASSDPTVMRDRLKNSSKPFSMCLYGPSGTGKSEYAKQLIKYLRKRVLYRKASDLLAPYLGETEAKIAASFKQAEDNNMILLIDEADTFLRSRGKADKAWEISQTNEMLSQMENLRAPFIVTTNLMSEIDTAALRRFTFKVSFDFLTRAQIPLIFKKYFKKAAPKDLLDIVNLTAGDFANVKNKIDILGIKDVSKIAEMLTEEAAQKPDAGLRRMGFC
jgi:transitional endoplasmic reticulum ATPase